MSYLKQILLPFLAILVIFEEWLWDMLAMAGHWLSLVLHLQRFDQRLSKATPQEALFALAIPIALISPVSLFSLYLLANGLILPGIILQIFAKLAGTLLVARIFRLVQPALLSFPWFARLYHGITRLLQWAHGLIRETAIYRLSLVLRQEIRLWAGIIWRYLRLLRSHGQERP